MRWDSREGLDSYNDYAYEHDMKLYDSSYVGSSVRPACSNDRYWATRSGRTMMSTNFPQAAGPYFDTDVSDGCGTMDFSFGLITPAELQVGVSEVASQFGLQGQKLSNDCQFLSDSPNCIGLNLRREGTDSSQQVNQSRNWLVAGCYNWIRGGSPTQGVC